jgi:hypothetical protein
VPFIVNVRVFGTYEESADEVKNGTSLLNQDKFID